MKKDELLELVNAICFGSTKNSLVTPLIEKILSTIPHSDIIDLIYWSDPELTPKQIVYEAIKRNTNYIAEHGLERH